MRKIIQNVYQYIISKWEIVMQWSETYYRFYSNLVHVNVQWSYKGVKLHVNEMQLFGCYRLSEKISKLVDKC